MSSPPYEYVALRNIEIAGMLVFAAGDFVPAGHVQQYSLAIGTDAATCDVRNRNADELPAGTLAPPAVRGAAVESPARNAGQEEWARYAVNSGQLDAETATGMGRDELVEQVGPKPKRTARARTEAAGDED